MNFLPIIGALLFVGVAMLAVSAVVTAPINALARWMHPQIDATQPLQPAVRSAVKKRVANCVLLVIVAAGIVGAVLQLAGIV